VFFVEPLWLCILIPILVAPIPVGAAIVIRQRRAPALEAACLAAAGLAMAFVLGGVWFATVLVAFVLLTHRIGLRIASLVDPSISDPSSARSRAHVTLTAAISLQVALFLAMARGALVDGSLQTMAGTLVPFGASYFAFHGISYLVDVYRRRTAVERSRLRLAGYLLLLPHIVAGPVLFADSAPHLARRLPNVSDYSFGVRRLVIGLWKVFVMAAFAAAPADVIFALPPGRLSVLQAWVGLAAFTLQMYYAFSGYADMGVGLGRMFGLRLPENFRWPFAAQTVHDFWRRWHRGLAGWFRDYAGVSAGGVLSQPPSIVREMIVVLLCGIWYGIGWTFVVWGAYHALLIAAERTGLEAFLARWPAILRHVYLVLVVSLGWILLRSPTLTDAWAFLRALIGANASLPHPRLTFGYEVWLTLVAGAIGCAPLSPMVRRWTVVIDALIVSGLMALFASLLLTWRGVRLATDPVMRRGRGSSGRAGRP
jgi:alginate O-acetyltransferase complex protein AlgI